MGSSGEPAPRPLAAAQMRQCLEALRAGFENADVINRRENRVVIRWRMEDTGRSIIVKMWSRTDWKGRLRRLLGRAACNHEWRNLARVGRLGVAVPQPLGFCRVVPDIDGYTDVLFMEDLGECELAMDYLKRLIRSGQEKAALNFENEQIDMTAKIVAAGMLDVDHGMLNIVVQGSGRAVKLDLELTRRVIWPSLFPGMYGQMLGRMIGLHAFTVQPEVGRTTRFAERLCERLRPPKTVLKRAGAHVRNMMQKQFLKIGMDTRIVLPWE